MNIFLYKRELNVYIQQIIIILKNKYKQLYQSNINIFTQCIFNQPEIQTTIKTIDIVT